MSEGGSQATEPLTEATKLGRPMGRQPFLADSGLACDEACMVSMYRLH